MIEVPVYQLRHLGELEKASPGRGFLTSLDALAMSEKAGGGKDMTLNWLGI